MRYRLRTLLIVLALGPPVLAVGWWATTELRRPRMQGCFGDDIGPFPRIVIQEEDEAKLGIDIEP